MVADTNNNKIRRINRDGTLTTIAGTGQDVVSGQTVNVPAVQAAIRTVLGLHYDTKGNLYFTNSVDGFVLRVSSDGLLTRVAGGGSRNPGDGSSATGVQLFGPNDVLPDASGNLYIAETNAHRIRKVAPDGTISTIAGTGIAGFAGDNGPAIQAQLNFPRALLLDANGNLYISDANNHRVRKVTPGGTITTVAGNGRPGFAGDGGPATSASLFFPNGLNLDASGNLYIADTSNNRLRRVAPDGTITTFAGAGTFGFSGDGAAARSAAFRTISDVAIDSSGNIFVVDSGNGRIRMIPGPAPTFSRSPDQLSFAARAGGTPPNPQPVTLTGSVVGLPYSLTITTSDGADWLRVDASNPTMPATLRVTVDPTNLTAGSYLGAILISAPNSSTPPQTVNVTAAISGSDPPRLDVDATRLAFSFLSGSALQSRQLTVLNRGGGALAFTATAATLAGGPWLSVTPQSGNTTPSSPSSLTVAANPSGLKPGTYTGVITLNNTTTGESLAVSVTMTINVVQQSIQLSQAGLTFTAVAGGGALPPQTVVVLNAGQGALSFNTQVTTLSGGNWLNVAPSSASTDGGGAGAALVVTVNQAGLDAGAYYGRIDVTSSTADNSPQSVAVVLNLLPAGSNPGPLVQPSALLFIAAAGGADPSSQTVLLTNLTSNQISFGSGEATLDGHNWITLQPKAASVSPGSLPIVVQPRITGLTAGVYRGAFTLVFSDGSIRTIGLTLVLTADSASSKEARAASGCTPTRLLPILTSLGVDFNVPASWPIPIETRVVDDCGNPLVSGAVVTSFSNGDPALSLVPLRDGRWAATWQSRNVNLRQITLTLTAQQPSLSISGAVQVSGGFGGNANPPVIAPGGVVSAMSLSAGTTLGPGSLISILGVRLAEGNAQASFPLNTQASFPLNTQASFPLNTQASFPLNTQASFPLNTQLAGTSVLLAGRLLPLLYSSDGQVNAVVPYDLPFNARQQLIVQRGASISIPESIVVAPAQPVIFTQDSSGKGQGQIFILNANGGQILASPANPARQGDQLLILCSGLGPVDVPLDPGAPAPSSPLANALNAVSVSIGGVDASVSSATLLPGNAGIYQVAATVPAGVAPSDNVPVVLTVAGQITSGVSMAVR